LRSAKQQRHYNHRRICEKLPENQWLCHTEAVDVVEVILWKVEDVDGAEDVVVLEGIVRAVVEMVCGAGARSIGAVNQETWAGKLDLVPV
jgi:hypothetical protein